MKEEGWKKIDTFKNPRTGNTVDLYSKPPRHLMPLGFKLNGMSWNPQTGEYLSNQ
jgi:hypothetical protein